VCQPPLSRRPDPSHHARAQAAPVPAQAADAPKAPSFVTFSLQRKLGFGDSVRLVGSDPAFGAWDAEAAPSMAWGEGDVWSWAGELPAGQYDFKVCARVLRRRHLAASMEAPAPRYLD
jgi:hypothetical protein